MEGMLLPKVHWGYFKNNESITGQYLSGKKAIVAPGERQIPNGKNLVVLGAQRKQSKEINVTFP